MEFKLYVSHSLRVRKHAYSNDVSDKIPTPFDMNERSWHNKTCKGLEFYMESILHGLK